MVSHDLAVFLAQLATNYPDVRVPQTYVDAARSVHARMEQKSRSLAAAGYERLDVTMDLSTLPRIGDALNG